MVFLSTGKKHFFSESFIFECFYLFLRNAPEESYEYEDDYKETDRLLDDEGRTEEAEENLSRAQKKQKKEKKPSLSKILWSLFGLNFAIAVLCKLVNDMLLFVQPQLLK